MNRTLTITIDEDWTSALKKDVRRAFQGEVMGETLGFASADLFFSKLTPGRLALLKAMQGMDACSIRELARRVGRDVRRVHDDVTALLTLGLIEKDADGNVHCPYDDIHLDMHLRAA